MPVSHALVEDLVAANRILAAEGVFDAFGHVSVRHPDDPGRYLMSRSLAPALVTAADIMEYDLESAPAGPRGGTEAGDRTPYLERVIHGEIYKVRSDVGAVVHHHSPSVIPFGVSAQPLRPIYHMAAFLGEGAPVFDIRDAEGMTDMLVRNPAQGQALARTLGQGAVALMRGHGAVVVGPTVRHVVARSIYVEVNARLQRQALALGPVTYLDPEEAQKADATVASVYGRPWELWLRKIQSR